MTRELAWVRNETTRCTERRSSRRVATGIEALEGRALLSAGDLDATFGGGDGTVPGGGSDIAIQSDGKIVVAGEAVRRYLPDGTLDTTFGGGDGVADGPGGARVAIGADGKIVVAGTNLVRYKPDGTLDAAFGGGDGVAPLGFEATDVGVQPSGRIVVTPPESLGLRGYNDAGQLDPSFGNGNGIVSIHLSGDIGAPTASGPLVVSPDGGVVVAGSVTVANYEGAYFTMAVARFTPDGTLDTRFAPGGDDGDGLTHFGLITTFFNDYASDIAIAPDGKIVVAGVSGDFASQPWTYSATLARLLPDGTLDASFDGDGRLPVGNPPNTLLGAVSAPSVAVQAGGKIILNRTYGDIIGPNPGGYGALLQMGSGLTRFNADGTLDASFGNGGTAFTPFGTLPFEGDAELPAERGVAAQSDGKIVSVGSVVGLEGVLGRYEGGVSADADDQTSEAYLAGRISTQPGRMIDSPSDVDLYRFDIPSASRRIGFDVDRAAGSALDSYLRVFDASGTQIASNDDAAAPDGTPPVAGDAYVEVTFPSAGVYYVGVSAKGNASYNAVTGEGDAGGTSGGGYTLTLTDRTPRAVGEFDYSFGNDGMSPGGMFGLATLPDGKFLEPASHYHPDGDSHYDWSDYDLTVQRYTAQGFLDTSFGPEHSGQAAPLNLVEGTPRSSEWADVAAALPDGRILAAGRSRARPDPAYDDGARIVVARYSQDGSPDPGFISNFMLGDTGYFDRPSAVGLDRAGNPLIAGTGAADSYSETPPSSEAQDFFLAGSFGTVTADFAGLADELSSMAVQPDGKVLLVGTATTATGKDFAAARFNGDGSIDTTFGGGDGKLTTDFGRAGGDDAANAVVLLPGGKFVIIGGATITDRSEIALAGYNADGSLDGAFGVGGKATMRLAAAASAGAALLTADGKIVVGGLQGFGLARFNADGSLDASFGHSGFADSPVTGIRQLLPLPDGNWLAAGSNGRARHLAKAVTAPPEPGSAWTIEGTAGNDKIGVTRSGNSLIASVNGSVVATRPLAEVTSIVLKGLTGNDTLDVANNITLPATLDGGPGNDLLKGGGGDDHLLGGDGDDVLDGRRGGDVFLGGAGRDAADYSSRFNAIHFGPGKLADDGETNEHDNIGLDVEDCYGGKGADYLNGSSADNRLYGGGGNDVLIGGGGKDLLSGGSGNDRLFSRDGIKDLFIDGASGFDSLQRDDLLDTSVAGIERLLS